MEWLTYKPNPRVCGGNLSQGFGQRKYKTNRPEAGEGREQTWFLEGVRFPEAFAGGAGVG